jgi:hypothetical protein
MQTFKREFFPRERVICINDRNERSDWTVREKIIYPEQTRDGQIITPAFSKYIVEIPCDHPELQEDGFFEKESLSRDRRSFSKQLIRSFLKNRVTKEAWYGAPWVVKEKYAIELRLPMVIPPHLQQSARMAEKKALAQQKKAQIHQGSEPQMLTLTEFRQHPNSKKNTPVLGPSGVPMMHRPWQSKPNGKQKHRFIQTGVQNYGPDMPPPQFIPYQSSYQEMNPVQYSPNGNGQMQSIVMYTSDQQNHFYPQGTSFQPISNHPYQTDQGFRMPTPPPPVKYPTEDLDVPMRETEIQRPDMKFFTDMGIAGDEEDESCPTGKYDSKSVGQLLGVWNTLNVHNEVYILDSFTFDDFAEAIRFSSDGIECELLTEVHCAVLKQLVDDKGDLMVDLPEFDDSESEDESEEEEEDEEDEDEPEPEPEPPRRTTRSSLAKAAELAREKSPTPEDPLAHRADELQSDHPWQEKCKERDFRGNRWQPILAGLLYQISLNDRYKERVDNILSQLLPPDEDPTPDTVIQNYALLDVNLRLDALEMIVVLSIRTKAIREQLERMSQEMTDLRKRKIEQQRLKKDL